MFIKCKGCKDDRVPEHDTLEGYCMLCAAQRIRENKELKERIKEFKSALLEYGMHKDDCNPSPADNDCKCEYLKALRL